MTITNMANSNVLHHCDIGIKDTYLCHCGLICCIILLNHNYIKNHACIITHDFQSCNETLVLRLVLFWKLSESIALLITFNCTQILIMGNI